MSYEPPRESDPVPRFIGWGLMAASVIWILLSGACVFWGLTNPQDGGWAMFLIGAVSAAGGVGIFFIGRMLARN